MQTALLVLLVLFAASSVGGTRNPPTTPPPSPVVVHYHSAPEAVRVRRDSFGPATDLGHARPLALPFRQVGTLTAEAPGGKRHILPLFSREAPARRGRYNMYTLTNDRNSVQVPVSYKKRNCMEELGCEEVFENEEMHVPAFGSFPFSVSLTPNNMMY